VKGWDDKRSAIHNAVAAACFSQTRNRHFDPKLLTLFVNSAAKKSASLPGALPKATHSIVITIAAIFFWHFPPKNRMSSPQTTKPLIQNKIELAF
jgi:hypothetical protein